MRTRKQPASQPTYGQALKAARRAAGYTVAQAAAAEGVSKRLWEYWEADQKLPPPEATTQTRERLLTRWQSKPNELIIHARTADEHSNPPRKSGS